MATQKITPCLWFDGNAEEAANFYVSVFPNSRVDAVVRAPGDYPSGGGADWSSTTSGAGPREFRANIPAGIPSIAQWPPDRSRFACRWLVPLCPARLVCTGFRSWQARSDAAGAG